MPDLVEKRRVLLKGGWAYVPIREQSSLVFQEFEDRLEKALEARFHALQLLFANSLSFVDHSTAASSFGRRHTPGPHSQQSITRILSRNRV